MAELEIRLLGRFQVLVDNSEIDDSRWSRKKAKVLVKLLALAPRHSMHREQLIENLWPELDADLALNNFHKVIHAARRALEPVLTPGAPSRFLLTQDSQVSLATGAHVRIDVDEFERVASEALRSGDSNSLQSALSLYRGDLLEEDLYEDWTSLQRERIRLVFQRVLERLAGNYEAAGDERAVEVLNRLITTDRANEQAHRRLMRIHAAMGQRHLALAQYRLCCEALKEELDAQPEAATVELYEKLIAGEAMADQDREARVETPALAALDVKSAAVEAVRIAAPGADTRSKRWTRGVLWLSVAAGTISVAFFLWRYFASEHGTQTPVSSLAILPLSAPGDGVQLAYLADGMTEGLINSTSRLTGIRVMARGTVFAYKGRSDAREIGRELKVSTVLSGRVSQQADALKVEIEMIDVGDGSRLWGRQYSVPSKDAPQLQPLLYSELAMALQVKLSASQREKQKRSVPVDGQAYRLYLTGRSYWNQRTRDGLYKSIEYYQQAIERDPGYALAYAGLADSYGLLGWKDGLPRDYFPKAQITASRALQLDESLAEAQTSLAMVSALYDWNWATASAMFRRAIEMNNGYATAHHWYGVHLGALGRFDEARSELKIALSLDPLSPVVNLNSGYPDFYQKRYRAAMDTFSKVVALSPSFAPAHDDLMTGFMVQKKLPEAVQEALLFLRFDGQSDLADIVEQANARNGHPAALRKWLEFWENRPAKEYVPPMMPARLSLWLGDQERAFYWLERAYQERSPQLAYLAVDPQYDPIRPDPRFKNLLKRIGFPLP